MNIMNKLTVRHLKENKRRTLVTIIGVIISVAMVTAVATLGVSFLDLLKRQTIADNGEWHVKYEDVNAEQLEAIQDDSQTEKLIVSNDRGYAILKDSENENKPYLFIKEYNEQGFTNFPIELLEGRLPKTNQEVVISESIADNANVHYKIGDTIKLDIGERMIPGAPKPLTQVDQLQIQEGEVIETYTPKESATFTVVGILERPTWEPTWSPGYTVISFKDKSMMSEEDTVDAVVILKNVSGNLYEHSESLVAQHNIPAVQYNSELLRFYGVTNNDNLRTTLFSLVAIIMGVIIVGSVSLIYNAFAISVSERARHLGMLSSVGATKTQKRNSVFFEGVIIGSISIPIGILSGLVGIGLTFLFINSYLKGALGVSERLELVVTPYSIIVASGISILTIFISTYLPARRASKVSAIDAIRQSQDIKLTEKRVKTSKFVRKFFGIEAEIGLKNLKRNKRRYQATVFSLVISIVLFLAVSFFTSNLSKSLEMSQDDINYDIQISSYNTGDVEELNKFSQLEYVTKSVRVDTLQLDTWIDKSNISEMLLPNIEEDPSILKDGKYPYYVMLHGMDDKNFNAYASKIGADPVVFQDKASPKGIVIDQISYKDYELKKFIETQSINADIGYNLDLFSTNYETNEQSFVNNITIGALTSEVPMGIHTAGVGGIDVIVPKTVFDSLVQAPLNDSAQQVLYMNSSNPMATQEAIEDIKNSDIYVYNVFQQRQQSEQLILIMSVFTYGFIALITSISIANILNTISTSISLRKREFAMLKSVGMTPKGFNKMINYESIFYGIKSLLYGLPLSFGVMGLIYWSMKNTFEYGFYLDWLSIIYVIIAIFLIVSLAMVYSISKVKKENIIDALKQENI